MRPILYPASEELIRNKKQQKLDEQEQGAQEESSSASTGRKRRKGKDAPEEVRVNQMKLQFQFLQAIWSSRTFN
ncbi:hypothetical protein RMATCC62417_11135 [Rhizopus microsporus]|nr:hypothetical protein RMATCC62417_11135 [Rhizopus microsporus]